MRPCVRTPVDGDFDEVSRRTGVSFDPSDDKTRQELKADADVNLIMRRSGGAQFFAPPGAFGSAVDFDVDLLRARGAHAAAVAAYEGLSPEVKAQYASATDFMSAVISGQFTGRVEAEVPSASEAAPPSETSAPATGGA